MTQSKQWYQRGRNIFDEKIQVANFFEEADAASAVRDHNEVATLREQVARLKAEPTHEEVNAHDLAISPAVHIPVTVVRRALVSFLAARATSPRKEDEQ